MNSCANANDRPAPRIGIDARPLFSGQQTGVSRYLRNVLDHRQADASVASLLLYLEENESPADLPPSWEPAEIRTVPSRWCSQKRAWENLALPRALRQDHVDLYFSAAYVLPIRLPCPAAVTIHDISFEVHPEWFPPVRSRYIRFFARRAARKARIVLTDSEFSRSEICERYGLPPEKVRAVPLASAPAFFQSPLPGAVDRVRREYSLPERFALYVGSMHQRRQIPEITRAMAQARRDGSIDHHLILLGHNNFHPARDMESLIAESGGTGFVHWIDFAPEEDLRAMYAAADFVVYVSRYEGFGLPVIEAMAAGRPVVTSRAASLPEVAGDAAILVDPTSVDEIADGFRRLALDRDLHQILVEKGKTHAREFSWERTSRETFGALLECLSR